MKKNILIALLLIYISPLNLGAQTSGISGIVYESRPPQKVIQDIYVAAYDYSSGIIKGYTDTNETGEYFIPLPAGSYKVLVETDNTYYIPVFYNNKLDSHADLLMVIEDTITSNINFSLYLGGRIEGFVTDNNDPLIDIRIHAYNAVTGDYAGFAKSEDEGKYSFCLPEGTYKLKSQAGKTFYVPKFYENAFDFNAAIILSVNVMQTIENKNFILEKGGKINGFIADSQNSNPISKVKIWAFSDDQKIWQFEESLANGSFSLCLLKGKYKIYAEADPVNTYFISKYFPELPFLEIDSTIEEVNLDLTEGGKLSGSLKNSYNQPISDSWIDIYNANTLTWVAEIKTKTDGSFAINVAPETYYIVYTDSSNRQYFYNNTNDFSKATPVNILQKQTFSGIDFILTSSREHSGDIDGDGDLTLKDIIITMKLLNGIFVQHYLVYGDITKNNKIDMGDYLTVFSLISK